MLWVLCPMENASTAGVWLMGKDEDLALRPAHAASLLQVGGRLASVSQFWGSRELTPLFSLLFY